HRFEKRGLRFRCRAIDLVGEKKIREDGTLLEFEFLRVRVIDRHADDVAGQHVGGELQTMKIRADAAGECLRESGFADAWNVFDKEVAAREQTGEREA